MPLYEYQCQQCGRRTEKRQKFSDAPLTECPYCGGALNKLLSAPAVQFKGGGWYADGYGSPKSSAANSSSETGSTGAKSDSGSASAASDTSKPATSASSDSSSSGSASNASSSSSASTASSSDK